MSYKLENTVHDTDGGTLSCKTPGLKNPETYVLSHNRFNTYMVLVFSDLNKTQIYKMPYRDCPNHELEIVISFNYLNLFKPNGHTKGYHIRKPNVEKFFLEVKDKKLLYVGANLVSFETNDKIVNFCSELGYNDINFPFAYDEQNIYFMLHLKFFPFLEYETSTELNEYHYLCKKRR